MERTKNELKHWRFEALDHHLMNSPHSINKPQLLYKPTTLSFFFVCVYILWSLDENKSREGRQGKKRNTNSATTRIQPTFKAKATIFSLIFHPSWIPLAIRRGKKYRLNTPTQPQLNAPPTPGSPCFRPTFPVPAKEGAALPTLLRPGGRPSAGKSNRGSEARVVGEGFLGGWRGE